jgi:hypothetical protein
MDYIRTIRKILFGVIAVAGVSYSLTLYAQQNQQILTPPSKPSGSAATASETKIVQPEASSDAKPPFEIGERMVYGVSLVGFPTAGRIEMEVVDRGSFFGVESYQIRTKVESLGQVRSLFGDIDSQLFSYAALKTALPHRFIQTSQNGLSPSEETVTIDQAKRKATFSDESSIALTGETYDIPSLVYALRMRPLAEKERRRYTLLYARELIEVEAEGRRNERVQTQAGSFNALYVKVTPKKKYNDIEVRVWFSNDARRLPVLTVATLPVGEVRAELASVGVTPRPISPIAQVTPIPEKSGQKPVITIIGSGKSGAQGSGSVQPIRGPGGPTPSGPSDKAKSGSEGLDLGKGPEDRTYPFVVGERINYDISWGNVATVGKASFEVRQIASIAQKRVFEFYGEAVSSGAVRNLITVNDQISSFALVDSLMPVRTDIRLREGKRVKQVTANYDWANGKADLSSGSSADIRPGTLDLLSLFYAIRASELVTGQSYSFSFLDANHRPQGVIVRPVKQETINSGLGARDAIQLDIISPNAKLLVAQVWLSNDSRRIPLYLVTRTQFGEVRFQITNGVNIK